MLKQERQAKILSLIAQQKRISVTKLSKSMNVSAITIRRDLDELAQGGKITRLHGGAAVNDSTGHEPPILHRQFEQADEKEAIAHRALSYIKDGDTVGIESGSTTLAMAKAIAEERWNSLNVITNSIPILNLLISIPGIHLMFLGGVVNPDELCINCEPSNGMLKHIHIDTFFCGSRGLHPSFGRSNEMQDRIEIDTVRAFVDVSDRIIVMVDHTKFSRVYPLQLLQINEIDVVITSDLSPEHILEDIRKQGILVDIAALPTPPND